MEQPVQDDSPGLRPVLQLAVLRRAVLLNKQQVEHRPFTVTPPQLRRSCTQIKVKAMTAVRRRRGGWRSMG